MKENDIRMKENDMTLFFQVLFHRPLFKDLFNEYTSDSKRVSLYEFQKFLAKEQGISLDNCYLTLKLKYKILLTSS